jgi:hypothetical protein
MSEKLTRRFSRMVCMVEVGATEKWQRQEICDSLRTRVGDEFLGRLIEMVRVDQMLRAENYFLCRWVRCIRQCWIGPISNMTKSLSRNRSFDQQFIRAVRLLFTHPGVRINNPVSFAASMSEPPSNPTPRYAVILSRGPPFSLVG